MTTVRHCGTENEKQTRSDQRTPETSGPENAYRQWWWRAAKGNTRCLSASSANSGLLEKPQKSIKLSADGSAYESAIKAQYDRRDASMTTVVAIKSSDVMSVRQSP